MKRQEGKHEGRNSTEVGHAHQPPTLLLHSLCKDGSLQSVLALPSLGYPCAKRKTNGLPTLQARDDTLLTLSKQVQLAPLQMPKAQRTQKELGHIQLHCLDPWTFPVSTAQMPPGTFLRWRRSIHHGNVYISGFVLSPILLKKKNPILSSTLIQEMNMNRTRPSLNVTSSSSLGQDQFSLICASQLLQQQLPFITHQTQQQAMSFTCT